MRVLVKAFWPAFCLIQPGLKLWKTFFSFGERNLRAQSKSRDSTNDGSTWLFLLVARHAATLGLWRAIPRVGELPFLKGFSLWTDQSERVYFYWPPGPNPVVTISTRVGPGSRLGIKLKSLSWKLELNRRVSHNVVTMETNAIGWPLWLITFWYSEFEEIMSIPNACTCACIIVQKSTGINM